MRFLFAFFFAFAAHAAVLEWDANLLAENVTNYVVTWKSGTVTNSASTGTNASYSLNGLSPGVYRLSLVAQAYGLDSEPSQELLWTNKPAAPKQLRIRVSLQSKERIEDAWEQDIRVLEVLTPADRQRIYRLGLAMESLE